MSIAAVGRMILSKLAWSGRATVAVAMLASFQACGGEDSGERSSSEPPAGPLPIEELETTFVDEYCRTVEPCCGTALREYDEVACREGMSDAMRFFMNKVQLGLQVYDAQNAGECVAAMKRGALGCEEPQVCNQMFHGLIPPGSSCVESWDCARGDAFVAACSLIGDQSPASSGPRACEQYVLVGEGDACIATCHGGAPDGGNRQCSKLADAPPGIIPACDKDAGFACDEGTQRCAPHVAEEPGGVGAPEGGSCRSDKDCRPDLACDEENQTCVPGVPLGAACDRVHGLSCADGARCEDSICRPTPEGLAASFGCN